MGVVQEAPEWFTSALDELPSGAREVVTGIEEAFRRLAPNAPLTFLTGRFDERRLRAFAWWVQVHLWLGPQGGHDYERRMLDAVRRVAKEELRWSVEEVQRLWRIANRLAAEGHTNYEVVYRIPLAATARLSSFDDRRRVLRAWARWLRRNNTAAWDAIGAEIEELLADHEQADAAARVLNAIREVHIAGVYDAHGEFDILGELDPFARMLADGLGTRLGAESMLPLLRHWGTAASTKPSKRWLDTARRLLVPEAPELMREILTRLAAYREQRVVDRWNHEEVVFLHRRTAQMLRGLVWTCELVDEPWVTPLLGDVAVTCGAGIGGMAATSRCELVANAAVSTLARRGGLDAVAELAKIPVKVRRKSLLANVMRALEELAGRAGLSREQLLDRTVPDFGLDADGVREEKIGDYRVRLCVDGPALRFVNPAGRTLRSAPQAIRKDPALAELRATVKELGRTLAAERLRLERALIEERVWRWHEVTTYLLDHPVTGHCARNLIWQVSQGPAGLPVRTGDGWELTDPQGRGVRPDPEAPVLLWHPIRASADEVRAWRDHLLDRGVRQPYKQAFREVYRLTPAERETGAYSLRFSGHVLRYGQAKALLTERGWTGLLVGLWDPAGGSENGAAIKEIAGLQVRWGMHLVGDEVADDHGTAAYCAGEEIRFYREGQLPPAHAYPMLDAFDTVPLTEVPPLVLSEVMRDADLAVSVTSIGLEPEVPAGHEEYWRDYGFGELGETAKTRRDVLARLLPRLKIADRLELTERFLVVRGDLRTYKIHLGSGNVLMEPNDAYLCIVPDHRRKTDQVFLPFEEDGGMLSIILSKAFLLAGDTSITDPTITRQLR